LAQAPRGYTVARAQRRTDLVDGKLDDRGLLAVVGLDRALPQPALNHHSVTAAERLTNVLAQLTPCRAAQEQAAVAPLAGGLSDMRGCSRR